MQFSKITITFITLLAGTALAAPAAAPSDVAAPVGDVVGPEPYFEEEELELSRVVDGPPPGTSLGETPEQEKRALSEEGINKLEARIFFGCPFDQMKCHKHCRSIGGGRKGGYCGNWFKRTCICYK